MFTIGADPVRFGLVRSLNRRGGRVTGVSLLSSVLGAKRVSLLHELAPRVSSIALLMNPTNPNAERSKRTLKRNDLAEQLRPLRWDQICVSTGHRFGRIGIERRNHRILQRRFDHLVFRLRRRWFRVAATRKQQHQ